MGMLDVNTELLPFSSPPSATSVGAISSKFQSQITISSPPPSLGRLWRQAAQRNLRNQWSSLASCRKRWSSLSSNGRQQATSLVNAYLSKKYMPAMDLGVLHDMPDIRKKACNKLSIQQDHSRRELLCTYKDMVLVVNHIVGSVKSMRCFFKGNTDSPIVQFSNNSDDNDDAGDCGGLPVFKMWPVSAFRKLGEELMEMFILELNLKRLLVSELVSIDTENFRHGGICWLDELYSGEFDDLASLGLYSKESHEIVYPRIIGHQSNCLPQKSDNPLDANALQVYLTIWFAEVNMDDFRCRCCARVGSDLSGFAFNRLGVLGHRRL